MSILLNCYVLHFSPIDRVIFIDVHQYISQSQDTATTTTTNPTNHPVLAPAPRQHESASRLGRNHTTQPSRLSPVAAKNFSPNRQIHRRTSHSDLDFEQALRQEGTVTIKESVDVSLLGMEGSPNPSFSTPRAAQPFNAHPPTLSGSSKHGHITSSSINEQEDAERHANRRSIYRSPGTSSSPDLATLVRKAKERGGAIPNVPHYLKERTRPPLPPLPIHDDRPSAGSTTTRPRSSTSHALNPLHAMSTSSSPFKAGRDTLNRGALTDVFPPEFISSPLQPQDEASKVRVPIFTTYVVNTVFV